MFLKISIFVDDRNFKHVWEFVGGLKIVSAWSFQYRSVSENVCFVWKISFSVSKRHRNSSKRTHRKKVTVYCYYEFLCSKAWSLATDSSTIWGGDRNVDIAKIVFFRVFSVNIVFFLMTWGIHFSTCRRFSMVSNISMAPPHLRIQKWKANPVINKSGKHPNQ